MEDSRSLPRPRCRVSVLDAPGEGWWIDASAILCGQTPRDARHALRSLRDRPATLAPVYPEGMRAALRASRAIEIEDMPAMLDRFLAEIGGEAGFDQWSGLMREELRLAARCADLVAERARLKAAEVVARTADDGVICVDRAGRFGTIPALVKHAGWLAGYAHDDEAGIDALRGLVAPYLWRGRGKRWEGPHRLQDVPREDVEEVRAWLTQAWRLECPRPVDTDACIAVPDMQAVAEAHAREGDGTRLTRALRDLAWRSDVTTYEADPAVAITIFKGDGRDHALAWVTREIDELEAAIRMIPDLWRTPAPRGVRHALARWGVEIRQDWETGAVRWLQAGPGDPLGILEHGPFLTLELAIADIAGHASPRDGSGTQGDTRMDLDIYVPVPGCEHGIVPGSGIVGLPDGHGRITCYYEGNLYGVPEMRQYRIRLLHAAGRMAQGSPTVARISLPSEAVRRVGRYDTTRWCVREVEDADALTAWAGEPLQAIAGQTFPAGDLDTDDPDVRRALEDLRPVSRSGTRSLWRTVAGQIVEHRPDRPRPFAVLPEE